MQHLHAHCPPHAPHAPHASHSLHPNHPPIGLYIHLPWCVRRCDFCDFNAHALGNTPLDVALQQRYINALEHDLIRDLAHFQREGVRLGSIYFGGGTPSLFQPELIGAFLTRILPHFKTDPSLEITMEANPTAAFCAKLPALHAAGINRLSIGVQSFDDTLLKQLTRDHNTQDNINALKCAQRAGFSNINVDLIYGIPSQNGAQILADVERAIAFGVSHISHYELSLEPNAVFYSRRPPLPDEDVVVDALAQAQALMQAAGFAQYEISAYAQPNARAIHNLNYWQFGDYIGIGAGAAGKITQSTQGAVPIIYRTQKPRMPFDYLEKQTLMSHPVPKNEQLLEIFLNTLRIKEGTPLTLLKSLGLEEEARAKLALFIAQGYLVLTPTHILPTPLGWRFMNVIFDAFL